MFYTLEEGQNRDRSPPTKCMILIAGMGTSLAVWTETVWKMERLKI